MIFLGFAASADGGTREDEAEKASHSFSRPHTMLRFIKSFSRIQYILHIHSRVSFSRVQSCLVVACIGHCIFVLCVEIVIEEMNGDFTVRPIQSIPQYFWTACPTRLHHVFLKRFVFFLKIVELKKFETQTGDLCAADFCVNVVVVCCCHHRKNEKIFV